MKKAPKRTLSASVQFDYSIPSLGNFNNNYALVLLFVLHLDSLSGVKVAETKIHPFQGDRPQLMTWEEYGIKIDVAERSLLEAETVEVAVMALVGGEFKFPENTVLVSAVYAVSLSKPLLKPLRLEMEHCVDLTHRSNLAKHLKFAIAPTNAPHLPYQFSLLEEGEFDSGSCYGSICRYKFCLVCIVGEVTTGGQEQQNEGSGGQQEGEGQEQQGGGGGGGGEQEQQGGLGGGGGRGGGGGEQEQQGGLGGGGGEQGGEGSAYEEVKGGKEQDEQPEGERKHQPQEVKQSSREGQQQQSADYHQQENGSGKSNQQHKQRQQIGGEYTCVCQVPCK